MPCALPIRSEEHTSELQSPCNLVCRLLLEKKNTPARGCPSGRIRCARLSSPPALGAGRGPLAGAALPPRLFFFFNDPATPEFYPLSLHDALPICVEVPVAERDRRRGERLYRPEERGRRE